MDAAIVLILLLALVPLFLQIFALNIFWQRYTKSLGRSADRPPFTTVVTIHAVGADLHATTRLLERRTRLDTTEIDALVARGGGRLPLPMSRPAANRLAQELRQLGASVELSSRDLA